MSSFEEILARDGRLIYKTIGVSMLPMLHQNRDIVVVRVPEGRLRKYDVALYTRQRPQEKVYVLHRVIQVEELGYLIRGDNTYVLEKVPDEAVIGVLTDFTRNGRKYSVADPSYRCYIRFWCAIYPLRAAYRELRIRVGRIVRKMGLRRLKTVRRG